MLTIRELDTGFSDAANYSTREHKQMLNKVFVNKNIVQQILPSHISFIVGDKGTGKTAYAVYISNNSIDNTHASLHFIMETEYQKFIQLKSTHSLVLSDYTQIWKVIIYLLMTMKISEHMKDRSFFSKLNAKFKNLISAVDDFYNHAFSPEIITAITFAEESQMSAQLVNKHVGSLGGNKQSSSQFTNHKYQINLFYLQKQFEEALRTLKLTDNYVIFIDGIDVRPQNIPHEEYLDCVRGLANAIWQINTTFFSNIKDSKGRMKVVLLVRPDIFNLLGLQNQNTKLRDNSMLLDWRTTYPKYRSSELFSLADRLLNYQQKNKNLNIGESWDYYFPFKTVDRYSGEEKDSFVKFLRFSLFRPRDIVTMLDILKRSAISIDSEADVFKDKIFDSPEFRRHYSAYMLGEIKDQISFYHTSQEYDDFLKFFSYLDGKFKFTYDEYLCAYTKFFSEVIKSNKTDIPRFFDTPEAFLQFLYELSIICYVQESEDNGERFISWCHKERNSVNTSPKVKTGVRYEIHYGLSKALNVGKKLG